jgi:hypothetical protein
MSEVDSPPGRPLFGVWRPRHAPCEVAQRGRSELPCPGPMRCTRLSAVCLGVATLLVAAPSWGQPTTEPHLQSELASRATRVTLEDAISRALAKNPTYATALLEIRRAEAVVRETKAAWLPTLYGNGGLTHLDGNRVNQGVVVESQNELAANLTLTVPLVMTRQWMTTEESRLNADATAATSADVRRTVAYATGQAYLAVYAQKLVIEVDERARDTAKSHADYAHQRYAGGVGNSLDEVRAQGRRWRRTTPSSSRRTRSSSRPRRRSASSWGRKGRSTRRRMPRSPPPQASTTAWTMRHTAPTCSPSTLALKAAKKTVEDDWSDYAPYLVGVAEPFLPEPPDHPLDADERLRARAAPHGASLRWRASVRSAPGARSSAATRRRWPTKRVYVRRAPTCGPPSRRCGERTMRFAPLATRPSSRARRSISPTSPIAAAP